MNFSDKIEEIYQHIKNKISNNQNRNKVLETAKRDIEIFFNQYMKKEFKQNIINLNDINQSICKYIENKDTLSSLEFVFIGVFIKYLSKYTIDVKYIVDNYEHLSSIYNCEQLQKKFIFESKYP